METDEPHDNTVAAALADMQARVPTRYVVTPDRQLKSGKYGLALMLLDEAGKAVENDVRVYVHDKSTRRFQVGHIYEIPTNGTRISLSAVQYIGQYKADNEKLLAWQAQAKAQQLGLNLAAREKREATDDSALVAALAPVAKAYGKLTHPQRLPFELWVLSVLRRKALQDSKVSFGGWDA